MDKIFFIGTFCFRIICENWIPIPEKFQLFEVEIPGAPDFTYRIHIVNRLPEPESRLVVKRPDLTVYEAPGGECRLIGIPGQEGWLACYEELGKWQGKISLTPAMIPALKYDTVFTSLFALERHMIKRDSLILHCAYIKHRGKSILFSAPSETGKSTQARLWEKYRGSETVNGDRALLRKKAGIWYACGWPICGSSEICRLENIPIHAIVMLRQGKKNIAERLSPMQAFTQMYGQITINQWNPVFVSKAVEKIEDLVSSVPVFQLTCDMTEGAVQCLERALFQDSDTMKDFQLS